MPLAAGSRPAPARARIAGGVSTSTSLAAAAARRRFRRHSPGASSAATRCRAPHRRPPPARRTRHRADRRACERCSRLARPSSRSACSTISISRRAAALGSLNASLPEAGESLRILAPAFKARPVPGGERGHLVEEKQLGVIAAPDVALAALEIQHAADPLPRRPAALGQLSVVGVDAPAAVAHEQAARRSWRTTRRTDRRGFAAAWHA